MSAAEHRDPPPVIRGDIVQALEVAAALRNVYSIEEGEGETPVIVEIGALPPEGHPDRDTWEIADWRFEVHVSCGEYCPVLAVVPYDFDSDGPHRRIAEAIAQAGEVILGLVERAAALEAENAALREVAEANADAVAEYAEISALMAADPVLCRYGVLEAFGMLKARADEALSEETP